MKKFFSVISLALIFATGMVSTSCNKNNGNGKCSLDSLDGTQWTSPVNESVMVLSFKGNGIELSQAAPVGNMGDITVIFTGTYTYKNPDFEGTFTYVDFTVPQEIFQGLTPDERKIAEDMINGLKDQFRMNLPGYLPGTVAGDAQSITTKGDTQRIFNRKK